MAFWFAAAAGDPVVASNPVFPSGVFLSGNRAIR